MKTPTRNRRARGSPTRWAGAWMAAAVWALALTACGGGASEAPADPGAPPEGTAAPRVQLLVATDQGLALTEMQHAPYGFLPPYATLAVQVVQPGATGLPRRLSEGEVRLTYESVADASGSRNSSSRDKTDFWGQVGALFNRSLAPGEGLAGFFLPADAPTAGPQPLRWSAAREAFLAEGLPLTPYDDAGAPNTYPLLRLVARDPATGEVLAQADVAVPVGSMTGCIACHATGALGARRAGVTWSAATDPGRQAKQNVLLLHDAQHATVLASAGTFSCVMCHHTRAFELSGFGVPRGGPRPSLSRALHGAHARALDAAGRPVFPSAGTAADTCAGCHAVAEASRGAMDRAGMDCIACHGSLAAVAGAAPLLAGGSLDGAADGAPRRSWLDQPRCESCHTGDALQHLAGAAYALAPDGLRLTRAYASGDAAASPLKRGATRFASTPGTPYHLDRGHAGLACAGCHGSAHAEWGRTGALAVDEAAPLRLQGHAGALIECDACHVPGSLPLTTSGPHGLHNVNDLHWANGGHAAFYASDPAGCQACHGTDLQGTALSRAPVERTFALTGRSVTIPQGKAVGCTECHGIVHGTDNAWVAGGHAVRYGQDPAACQTCHGAALQGSSLSVAAADRTYTARGSTFRIARGTPVGCSACHVLHDASATWATSTHGTTYGGNPGACTLCHGSDLKGTSLSVFAADRTYTYGKTTSRFTRGATVACSACHVMHATTSSWVGNHDGAYKADPVQCRMCHGHTLAGSLFSVAAANRTYSVDGKTVSIAQGTQVTCTLCHGKP